MRLTLTAQAIESKSACPEGVAAFRQVFGESATVEWTREKQIGIITGTLGKYVGWAYATGLIPLWSMSGSDLSDSDLRDSDLRDAYATSLYEELFRQFGWELHEGRLRKKQ